MNEQPSAGKSTLVRSLLSSRSLLCEIGSTLTDVTMRGQKKGISDLSTSRILIVEMALLSLSPTVKMQPSVSQGGKRMRELEECLDIILI